MKARLVRIGNSRGVRLPKAVIDQVGLEDEIDIQVEDHRLVIVPVGRPRAGWAEAAARASNHLDRLDTSPPTHFDEAEWQW